MKNLLNDFEEHKDGQHDTHQRIQTHDGAQQGENDAHDGDLRQQTDHKAAYDVDQHIDDEGNDKGFHVSCLESSGEKLLQNIHIQYISYVFI